MPRAYETYQYCSKIRARGHVYRIYHTHIYIWIKVPQQVNIQLYLRSNPAGCNPTMLLFCIVLYTIKKITNSYNIQSQMASANNFTIAQQAKGLSKN